jgi:hypothetical protein
MTRRIVAPGGAVAAHGTTSSKLSSSVFSSVALPKDAQVALLCYRDR